MFSLKCIPKLSKPYQLVRAVTNGKHCAALSSKDVRDRFLDFFTKEQSHVFVPSSSVIPFTDPSLSFVNAGMNQFKPVFLGEAPAPCQRAANSQKCIRVGGKHNDLNDVGRDGYHHTFFEMLGSWSFNDYFKAEACQMAWQLLTEVYQIPPEKLFVSYFGGCKTLGIPEDVECRDIWLSLGVNPEHLLPFGIKDNFWEMGLVGPCGPCSEIHVNKANLSPAEARKLVNQGTEDVVEIWNLVFMQYNRLSGDVLERLPAHHIDTGMGLERLVTFLQNKKSNYDTDLFMPLIKTVHKIAGGDAYGSIYDTDCAEFQRDCAYRILADHSRMITVALADGAFPDSNHRLRRVIRQAFVLSRKHFNQNGASLMWEMSQRVSDILGDVYPELHRNLANIRTLLHFEDELFREQLSKSGREWTAMLGRYPELSSLPDDCQPGLVAALPHLDDWQRNQKDVGATIPAELAFKLYNTHGLQDEALELVATLKRQSVDWIGFKQLMAQARMETLNQSAPLVSSKTGSSVQSIQVPATDWQCQENYDRSDQGHYEFRDLSATVTALLCQNGESVMRADVGERVVVITDRSCFYCEAGGQVSDTGVLIGATGRAQVVEARQVNQHIHHVAVVAEGSILLDQSVEMRIDADERIKCMANHTATHLLQASLKKVLGVTCQKSSQVSPDHFRFDFGVFQPELALDTILEAESKVRDLIRCGLPVERTLLPIHQAVTLENITLIPGESYPDVLSVIRIDGADLTSLEPCCGTHVRNTADLQEFAIISLKSAGIGSRSVRAVTRGAALEAYALADEFRAELKQLEAVLHKDIVRVPDRSQLLKLDTSLKEMKSRVSSSAIPFGTSKELGARADKLESLLRSSVQESLADSMRQQVECAVDADPYKTFVVVALSIPSELLDMARAKLSLIKATRHVKDKPILVLAIDGGFLVGRFVVPEASVTATFDAEKWAAKVVKQIGGKTSAPKGQDSKLSSNFRSRKIAKAEAADNLLQRTAKLATQFATNHQCSSSSK